MSDHGYIVDNIARVFGILLLGLGVQAHLRPLEGNVSSQPDCESLSRLMPTGAKDFGLPDITVERARLFPVVGGRNMTLALSVLVLSFRGHREAVGIVMGSSIAAGMSDAWVCWQAKGNWQKHLWACVVAGGLSWTLIAMS